MKSNSWIALIGIFWMSVGGSGLALAQEKKVRGFRFVEKEREYLDLFHGDRQVLRFVHKPHDGKDPEAHALSFKPFHQVFDPRNGTILLSSGAHPNTKEFRFPHHRGLFFGFNRISFGDSQTADIWHGSNGVFSTCDKILSKNVDTNTASHTAAISWHGRDGETFAEEVREVIAYDLPGGTQVDWHTTLTTKLEKVRLDGDPQHAGFHFRAPQEVAQSTSKKTYFLRPDGKGAEGETRNWDSKGKDPRTINLPWNAMSFVVSNQRFTVLRINHPDNPRETRGSERDYGRFGDYFEYDLTPNHPLKIHYRLWIQEGEMTQDQCQSKTEEYWKKMSR